MRILSQDKKIDVPYKQCGFIVFFNELFSGNWDINANIGGNKAYKMAEYSTEAKARKAMEMLHGAYVAHTQFKIMTEVQRSVFLSSVSEKEQDNLYGLFRFPTDDEVEV